MAFTSSAETIKGEIATREEAKQVRQASVMAIVHTEEKGAERITKPQCTYFDGL